MTSTIKFIFVLATAFSVLATPLQQDSSPDLVKRDDPPSLWGPDGPKKEDIWQGPHTDWLQCGAAKLASMDEWDIRSRFSLNKDLGAKSRTRGKVELYHDTKFWQQRDVNFNVDMLKDNSVNTDADKHWWPAALEVAAGLILDKKVDDKNINAVVGLRLLTGRPAQTKKLEGDNEQVRAELWNVLLAANKTPTCIWKSDRWMGVLSAKDVTETEQGQITMYDTWDHKEVTEGIDAVYKATTYYSKLDAPL
ncbi:uncharacterized protein I303_105270 [Kwoniella dejecticola CBS 10117]|uniref:Calpain catalytic domain-containing protein n=1 Tax=Kwoniella dejecticola CBS 10117 TaxID=1296121 RepID=A0A1A6A2Z4_9TREE|nr:uncharacterized protein I303_05282 [Kwoniella dejecticola CBS 10117]OBR84424.1 hypothetical protein I303_05282 [Kwoniella dejecticola CBS 10117]